VAALAAEVMTLRRGSIFPQANSPYRRNTPEIAYERVPDRKRRRAGPGRLRRIQSQGARAHPEVRQRVSETDIVLVEEGCRQPDVGRRRLECCS
jgi:hypothetical protein